MQDLKPFSLDYNKKCFSPRQKDILKHLFTIHYYLLLSNPRGFSEKWRVKSEKVIPKDKSSGICVVLP